MFVRHLARLLTVVTIACFPAWAQGVTEPVSNLVSNYVQSVNARDVDAMLSYFADDERLTVVVNGRVMVGAQAIRAEWARVGPSEEADREQLTLSTLRDEPINETTSFAFATLEIGKTKARPEPGQLAMSLVLRQTEGGLKIWHMHASAR